MKDNFSGVKAILGDLIFKEDPRWSVLSVRFRRSFNRYRILAVKRLEKILKVLALHH
jgi:hypothetical protein